MSPQTCNAKQASVLSAYQRVERLCSWPGFEQSRGLPGSHHSPAAPATLKAAQMPQGSVMVAVTRPAPRAARALPRLRPAGSLARRSDRRPASHWCPAGERGRPPHGPTRTTMGAPEGVTQVVKSRLLIYLANGSSS